MKIMKDSSTIRALVVIVFLMIAFAAFTQSSSKPSIAVVSIDTKGLEIDSETMGGLVRLELEKIDRFEVLDKYDVRDVVIENNVDPDQTFGKTKVIAVGELLDAEKMLTGSSEKYGNKIIFILRLIDVEDKIIEKTTVMEFLDIQEEIQTMVMISLNELLGIDNDPHLVDLLIDYNIPVTTSKTTLNLSGPRIGAIYTAGEAGRRLRAPEHDGGYDMFPVSSMFGYQFEQQYLSSGDFQALVELFASINGLESGTIVPSITFLNGFRFNKSGIEFGVGPILRLVKKAKVYQDENGEWNYYRSGVSYEPGTQFEERIDSNGTLSTSLGLLIGIGKTFRSGYLNMPVNLYVIPRKEGNVIGLTFGFNTTRKPSF